MTRHYRQRMGLPRMTGWASKWRPSVDLPMRLNVASALLFVGSLLVCIESYGQTPEGFHWVDFKRDASTVSKVERALRDEDYSVIREIGVTDAFVLVLTVRREPGQTNFWGDESRVYNI